MAHVQSTLITIKEAANKGLGVFAVRRIPKDAEIERVPVLILPEDDIYGQDRASKLAGYVFEWEEGEIALALGYGSLYNHSFKPNAQYWREGDDTQIYVALRDIEPGEEITINYNRDLDNHDDVGFEVV